MKHKPKAIAAYVYAGGFSLGVRKHFDVDCHFEDNPPYGEEIIETNPRYFRGTEIVPEGLWEHEPRSADLLFANPPCAPFNMPSKAHGNHWSKDPRTQCLYKTAKLTHFVNPKLVLVETVTQALNTDPLDSLTASFHTMGFNVTRVISWNHLMGSCQKRKRLMMVAHKAPLAKHPRLKQGPDAMRVLAKVADPGQITTSSDKFKEFFGKMKPGESVRQCTERVAGEPLGASFGVRKIRAQGPCCTLSGYNMIHPTKARPIGLNEYSALGGFPKGFNWNGLSPGKVQPYIARGLDPNVAEWFARWMLASLDTGLPTGGVPTCEDLYLLEK